VSFFVGTNFEILEDFLLYHVTEGVTTMEFAESLKRILLLSFPREGRRIGGRRPLYGLKEKIHSSLLGFKVPASIHV
jgi:hypothetical protein